MGQSLPINKIDRDRLTNQLQSLCASLSNKYTSVTGVALSENVGVITVSVMHNQGSMVKTIVVTREDPSQTLLNYGSSVNWSFLTNRYRYGGKSLSEVGGLIRSQIYEMFTLLKRVG